MVLRTIVHIIDKDIKPIQIDSMHMLQSLELDLSPDFMYRVIQGLETNATNWLVSYKNPILLDKDLVSMGLYGYTIVSNLSIKQFRDVLQYIPVSLILSHLYYSIS